MSGDSTPFREDHVSDNSLEPHAAGSAAGHGAVAQSGSHAVVTYNPDAPSEEWGWHGHWRDFAPTGSRILLWAGVALLFLLNFTTHVSHTESYYYNGIAILMAAWLVSRDVSHRRKKRRAASPIKD